MPPARSRAARTPLGDSGSRSEDPRTSASSPFRDLNRGIESFLLNAGRAPGEKVRALAAHAETIVVPHLPGGFVPRTLASSISLEASSLSERSRRPR